MASVFDNVPELGGVEADARSVRHALALQHNLLGGATRYRREGSIITHNPNPIPNLNPSPSPNPNPNPSPNPNQARGLDHRDHHARARLRHLRRGRPG